MKTHLDLFSGIGGFALAAGWAGFNTIGFCEVEDYPRRILSKRFPGVRLHGDIRKLDGSAYRGVSLITGGYPCQPFSQAGKRQGAADDRHLWPEMLRVVKQARPAWVLAENVAGHITMGLDEVLLDLESEGYTCRTVMVPACAKNALHRRDRVWIIAKRIHDAHSVHNRSTEQERQHERPQDSDRGLADKLESRSDVAHSDSKRGCSRDSQRQDAEDAGQSSINTQHRARGTQPRMGGAVDGLSEGLDMPRRWGDGSWEDGVPRVTVGAKNRKQRLKALGNAIVVQVAYELIRHLEVHG